MRRQSARRRHRLRCGVGAVPADGAPGFAADSQLAKARRDLNGLLYADGIDDSLYRAVGRALITMPPAGALLHMRALHREG